MSSLETRPGTPANGRRSSPRTAGAGRREAPPARTLAQTLRLVASGAAGLSNGETWSGVIVEGTLCRVESKKGKPYACLKEDQGEKELRLEFPEGGEDPALRTLRETADSLVGARVRVRGDLRFHEYNGGFYPRLCLTGLRPTEGPDPEVARVREREAVFASLLDAYAAREKRHGFPDAAPLKVRVIHPLKGSVAEDFANGLEAAATGDPGTTLRGRVEVDWTPVSIDAAGRIVEAIRSSWADVLVLIRGGGEERRFGVFDEEEVLRAWIESPAYTISALGHSKDLTKLDGFSDQRCDVPHAAGALVGAGVLEAERRRQEILKTDALRDERSRLKRALETAESRAGKVQAGLRRDLSAQAAETRRKLAAKDAEIERLAKNAPAPSPRDPHPVTGDRQEQRAVREVGAEPGREKKEYERAVGDEANRRIRENNEQNEKRVGKVEERLGRQRLLTLLAVAACVVLSMLVIYLSWTAGS